MNLAAVRDPYEDCQVTREGFVLPCGDLSAALKTAEAERIEQPDDTILNTVRLPTVRAAIELQRNQPGRAIELLQAAAPYERAYPGAIHLRGLAYLRLRKSAEAESEFQKILDHKGANWGSRYPLAYVGLARSAALGGDIAKAKKAYQDFLALWKDADLDTAILIEARQEYTVLK